MRLVACGLAAALAGGLACSTAPRGVGAKKLVVIAVDGLDHGRVARGIAHRRLPALAQLASRGGLYRLTTSASTQTASAWTTVATGVDAGKHNHYDAVARDPRTYQLHLTRTPPNNTDVREELAFWTIARRAGIRCRLVDVPAAFDHMAWLADTHLDDEAFLRAADRVFNAAASRILTTIEGTDWELLVAAINGLDRVQHVMWRLVDPQHPLFDAAVAGVHGDAIEKMYQRADRLIGDVLNRVGDETTVIVLSAYGVQPFRAAVNLNSWLVERGYMHLRRQLPRSKTLDDLVNRGTFFDNVDWPRTRAYALGFGQIYVNLRGREAQGTIAAGAEYDELIESLIIDLMNFLDPRTQDRVVASVHKRAEIYDGPFVDNAPDLLVGLEPGYRVSWQSVLGATPPHVVEANTSRWSADHRSITPSATPGVLLTSRPATSAPRHIDIAPTVLSFFGLHGPSATEGRTLF